MTALLSVLAMFAGFVQDAPADDARLVLGKWVAVEWEKEGADLDETEVRKRDYRLEFTKDAVKITDGGKTTETKYVLDQGKLKLGDSAGQYELSRDTLRLSLSPDGTGTNFTTKKGSPAIVVMLRRPENVLAVDPEVEKVRAELIALETKAIVEFDKKQSPLVEKLVPKDAIAIDANGGLLFGRDNIGVIDSSDVKHVHSGWRVVKISPETFLLVYKTRTIEKGQKEEAAVRQTRSVIWTKRDGQWMSVFTQDTDLRRPEAAAPAPKE